MSRLVALSIHVPDVPKGLHPSNRPTSSPNAEGPVPSTSLQRLINDTLHAGTYSSICLPITNELWRERWKQMCLIDESTKNIIEGQPNAVEDERMRVAEAWRVGKEGMLTRDEVNITRLEEAECTIGMAADWLELDSPDPWTRFDSELALKQELAHASYLGIQNVILPAPRNRDHVADYARAVNSCLLSSSISQFTRLSVRIPLYIPTQSRSGSIPGGLASPASNASFSSAQSGLSVLDADMNTMWEIWENIRTICGYNPRLTLTLDLSAPTPSSPVHARWAAEPVANIFLPALSYVPNSRGYPVLTKGAQSFIKDMVQFRPIIILSSTKAGIHSNGGENAYPQYIRHLEKTSDYFQALETPGTVESFANGYADYLQAPLQPLMDNLQSSTYETFEKDPVKYERYEEAVYRALCDRPPALYTIICVAGAGRGGIVARCVAAVIRAGRQAKTQIYALEKNPAACITLQERKQYEWGEHVELVFGDMRSVELPEGRKADILVSELLGSFGDNELSPECLDGAMRFLKPNGVSIPSSYTAHLAPLSSTKLWSSVCAQSMDRKLAETPYVVMFQAVNILSADGEDSLAYGERIQEAWEFIHPRSKGDIVLDDHGLPLSNTHNVRSTRLTFHIPHAGVLHGLAGYFDCVLYNDVGISIHPDRQADVSPNMLSWFPIFFPFKEPLYLPDNAQLDVSMWRLTDKQKVWYEWSAESFLAVPTPIVTSSSSLAGLGILSSPPQRNRSDDSNGSGVLRRIKIGGTTLHNPGGRSSWVGL